MKKIVAVSLAALSLFASDKLIPQNKLKNILNHSIIAPQLNTRFKDAEFQGVEKGDFYIIHLKAKQGEASFFVTKDLKYTILGQVLDNKAKRPLVADFPAKPFKGNKEVVKDGVVFSFGKGSKDLYVVTDPECPFCRKFEKIAKESHLADKYKIHIIFLPLPFHKHAKDMIYYILSADTDQERAKRFRETLTGSDNWKTFKPSALQKAKIDKELKKSLKAVDELGARGTPTFYDENMKEIKNRSELFK
jgi:thiol:disulfide interchange protein DsbC